MRRRRRHREEVQFSPSGIMCEEEEEVCCGDFTNVAHRMACRPSVRDYRNSRMLVKRTPHNITTKKEVRLQIWLWVSTFNRPLTLCFRRHRGREGASVA